MHQRQWTGCSRLLPEPILRSGCLRVASPYTFPILLDLEVAQVLRRLAREGVISSQRGHEAIQDLTDLKAARYPHWPMLREIGGTATTFPPLMPFTLCSLRQSPRPSSPATHGLRAHPAMPPRSNCSD